MVNFILVTLMSCSPITGPNKISDINSCGITYRNTQLKTDTIQSLTPMFNSYPTEKSWVINKEYCEIRTFPLDVTYSVEDRCVVVLDKMKRSEK